MRIQCSCLAWLSDLDKASCARAYVLRAKDREAFTKTLAKDLAERAAGSDRATRRDMTFMGAPEAALASNAEVELRERVEEALAKLFLPLYECKVCGRVFIQETRGSKQFGRFEPEYTTRRPIFE